MQGDSDSPEVTSRGPAALQGALAGWDMQGHLRDSFVVAMTP